MSTLHAVALSPAYLGRGQAANPEREVSAARVLDQQAHADLAEMVASLITVARGVPARAGGTGPELREPVLSLSAAQAKINKFNERLHAALQPAAGTLAPARTDADRSPRAPDGGVWIVKSTFSQLLALLREVLLKFEKLDRDNSADMVILSREMTITAGDKGVEKAKESLGAAIGGGVLMFSVGAAAMQQSMKSTKQQVDSHNVNKKIGHGYTRAAGEAHSAGRSIAPVSPPKAGPRQGPGGASLPGEGRGGTDAMKKVMDGQSGAEVGNQGSAAHDVELARAQTPASMGVMLNMLAPSTNAIIINGVNIEAEMTEAERQMALHVVDVYKRTADANQDQANKSREQRDATAQLVDSLLNMSAGTSGHIIGRY